MRKRGNWGEFEFSDYTFWMVKFKQPSDGWDQTRVRLIIGFWRFFLSINLWKTEPFTEFGKESPEYGISFHNDIIWIAYGPDSYTINMPWQWQIVRHDLLNPDGSVQVNNRWNFRGKKIGRHLHWHEILTGWHDKKLETTVNTQLTRVIELDHHTKEGKHQKANIRLTGEEREWRWRWFTWLPFPRMIHRVVDCDSDVELGDRAGSWKGGMMGWSVPWKKDESMEYAFRQWYKKWDGN